MGRGLSPLQKTILDLTVKYRNADVGCVAQDILATAYGFEAGLRPFRSKDGSWIEHLFEEPTFSRKAEGPRRYQAAHAAVSRALRRLERRSLIRWDNGWRPARRG